MFLLLLNIKSQIQAPIFAEAGLQHSPPRTFRIHSAFLYQQGLRIIQMN